jgi:hypothetical protein
MPVFHRERHRTQHIGWLRAAVLGANDGIVSTASLVVGVAASNATHNRNGACHILGGSCNGNNGRHRSSVWDGRVKLKGSNGVTLRSASR